MQIDSFVEFLQGHWKNKCFSNARPIEYLKGIITTAYVQQKEREMINEVEDFLRLMKAKMDYQAQKMERVYLANIHEQTMEASANS